MNFVKVKLISDGEIGYITTSDWECIKEFQKPIKDWKVIDKILVDYANKQRSFKGWDFIDLIQKYPLHRKPFEQIMKGGFTTVKEILFLYEDKQEIETILQPRTLSILCNKVSVEHLKEIVQFKHTIDTITLK